LTNANTSAITISHLSAYHKFLEAEQDLEHEQADGDMGIWNPVVVDSSQFHGAQSHGKPFAGTH